jgi:hypothetical protein
VLIRGSARVVVKEYDPLITRINTKRQAASSGRSLAIFSDLMVTESDVGAQLKAGEKGERPRSRGEIQDQVTVAYLTQLRN